jgi:eukaryotic-like serine/threonine-protein kinase
MGVLLSAGVKLGPYEILAPIGAGGMGEVYRARDTKLKRDVALKVLPEVFAKDSGRMKRFQREAEVLASLNHPNIAQIYGVEERALVMELVEGESPKGPMAFDDAWRIAMQIATALEYAHDRGVIHRDLKPANVKVTPDGVVKLLDFGLAKAYSGEPDAAPADPSVSPTLTLGATVAGTIMGTAAYMSPEQARGKVVDKRADIWSWGVMLYELLTGERLFQGEDTTETLAAVIHKQPDLEKAPPQVRNLLSRCLEKDRKNRLRDIGDARYLSQATAVPAPALPSRAPVAWIAAALFAVIAALTGFIAWQRLHEEPPALTTLSFPAPERGFEPVFPTEAVSPDGRCVAFVARPGVWVRELGDATPRKVADVSLAGTPFWAPDSKRLGFLDRGAIKIVDGSGSPPVTIANINPNEPGMGSWNRNDDILVSEVSTPVYRISAKGGSPSPVTQLDRARNETGHIAPWFLPDGRHFLYIGNSAESTKTALYVGDLASTTRKQLLASGSRTIYVDPGYLLFVRGSSLMAQRFDAEKLETSGDAVRVADQVNSFNDGTLTLGHFSASQNGVLAYLAGNPAGNVQLTWFDRKGNKSGAVGAPGLLRWPSLSPDESRIAFARLDPSTANYDVWIWDVTHGSESRFTSTGSNQFPVWSNDGAYIFFSGSRDGPRKIYRKSTSGTGQEEVVVPSSQAPADASRDGRYLLSVGSPARIWVIPLMGDRKPFPYMASEFTQTYPRLSPDGRWLAYVSNEAGPAEIYVASFPQPGGKWRISTGGGFFPIWSHDGHELYYYGLDNQIMAVDIKPGAAFQYGVPTRLFAAQIGGINTDFVVSKDGRFLLPVPVEQGVTASMSVVLNWTEMLSKK